MDARWSLLTGGIAARDYIQDARRRLRTLGVLVPPPLRARTALVHLLITILVGFGGSLLGVISGVSSFVLVMQSGVSGPWMPLPEIGAFLLGFILPFYLCVRLGYVTLLFVYRRALRSLARAERSGSVSSSASVAVPGSGSVPPG